MFGHEYSLVVGIRAIQYEESEQTVNISAVYYSNNV